MKKYFAFLVCSFALFSVVFRGGADVAEARVPDNSGWADAAYSIVGDICAENAGADIIYFYREKGAVHDSCALGIKRAMVTCEPTVAWQGMVECGEPGVAEAALRTAEEYDIGITHVLADNTAVAEECLLYTEESGRDIAVLYIPSAYQ